MKLFGNIICCLGVLILGYLAARLLHPDPDPIVIEKTKVKTVVKREPQTFSRPEFKTSFIFGSFPVEVVTEKHDTVLVEIPMERRVYEQDSVYRAVVSGVRPSLDTLIIFNTITETTVTDIVRKQPRGWSFGGAAGLSALVTPSGRLCGGLGVSVGISYWF